jgi:hypothetical protein
MRKSQPTVNGFVVVVNWQDQASVDEEKIKKKNAAGPLYAIEITSDYGFCWHRCYHLLTNTFRLVRLVRVETVLDCGCWVRILKKAS